MKIKATPADLQMLRFATTELHVEWIPREGDQTPEAIKFDDYLVEFDLDARPRPEHPEDLYFFMDIWINHAAVPLAGYRIHVSGNAMFRIANFETQSPDTLYNLQVISPASLMINTLRSAISDATSYSVLGRYNLPAIDILSLIKEKALLIQKKRKKAVKK